MKVKYWASEKKVEKTDAFMQMSSSFFHSSLLKMVEVVIIIILTVFFRNFLLTE